MDNNMINREIAEKVMGWENNRGKCWCFKGTDESVGYMLTGVIMGHQWQPSTNIAHAFEVVEKMRKNGFSFCLWSLTDCFDCYVSTGENDTWAAEINGTDTPSMAICLAALEAVRDK